MHDDGVDVESSAAYHRLVCGLFLLPALYREQLGLDVPASYRARLEAMGRFTAAILHPDGSHRCGATPTTPVRYRSADSRSTTIAISRDCSVSAATPPRRGGCSGRPRNARCRREAPRPSRAAASTCSRRPGSRRDRLRPGRLAAAEDTATTTASRSKPPLRASASSAIAAHMSIQRPRWSETASAPPRHTNTPAVDGAEQTGSRNRSGCSKKTRARSRSSSRSCASAVRTPVTCGLPTPCGPCARSPSSRSCTPSSCTMRWRREHHTTSRSPSTSRPARRGRSRRGVVTVGRVVLRWEGAVGLHGRAELGLAVVRRPGAGAEGGLPPPRSGRAADRGARASRRAGRRPPGMGAAAVA